MISSYARVELQPGLARHLREGHPWVFKRGLAAVPRLPAGAVVDVCEGGRFAARGYFDPHSAIAVRVLTRDPSRPIDSKFFDEEVARCLAARRELLDLSNTDSFRWIHGESDGLPGIIVDVYAGFAVVKLYSAGLKAYRAMLIDALTRAWPELKGIVGRDEVGRDDGEGDELSGEGQMLWGQKAPQPLKILENGLSFWVDVYAGQKTGFFLDQRDNRALIRTFSKGRDVLNCFCFSGGFSVNAAMGGATRVFSVDQDADAIALARDNFEANGLRAAQHDFLAGDAFELLASFKEEGRTFDMVILDPPAFAKSQKAVEGALAGYASLNRQAMALLRPGAMLATASCSARVSVDEFMGAIKEAAVKSRLDLRLVAERYQQADHPVRLGFPEGRYLKFYVFRVAG